MKKRIIILIIMSFMMIMLCIASISLLKPKQKKQIYKDNKIYCILNNEKINIEYNDNKLKKILVSITKNFNTEEELLSYEEDYKKDDNESELSSAFINNVYILSIKKTIKFDNETTLKEYKKFIKLKKDELKKHYEKLNYKCNEVK